MQEKSVFLSKTLWVNLILAITAFIPSVGSWIAAHPDVMVWGVTIVNMALRLITKDDLKVLT